MANETTPTATPVRSRVVRKDPLTPRSTDSYRASSKAGGATRCPECGAVYQAGRWCWLPKANPVHEQRCPACQRLHDHQPAGYLRLTGSFLEEHESEFVALVHNIEVAERKEHPLQRIMAIERTRPGEMLITTTDHHLVRRLGEAIRSSFQGEIDFKYGPDENLVRAEWSR